MVAAEHLDVAHPADAVHPDVENDAAIVRSGFVLTAKLLALLERFDAAGVEVLPIKGPVLSQVLYGDPAAREYEDLDLLVRREDAQRAASVLLDEGYKPESAFSWLPFAKIIDLCCEVNFRRACGTVVDLHWELAPSDNPFRIDPDVLWSSTANVRIAGRSVPTLSPECLIWFVSMHGAKHAWMRRQWVADVARLIETTPAMDWARVFEIAGEDGGEHVVLLAALLARDLYGAPLPDHIGELIQNDDVIAPLAQQVKQRFLHSSPGPLLAHEFTVFNAAMAKRRWDKIRHYTGLLKAPTEAEARVMRLPVKLFFLYYPFRVLRLAWKHLRPIVRKVSGF